MEVRGQYQLVTILAFMVCLSCVVQALDLGSTGKDLDVCYVYRKSVVTDDGSQDILAITHAFELDDNAESLAQDACDKPKVFWLDDDDNALNTTLNRDDAFDLCFLHKEKEADGDKDIFFSTAFYLSDDDDDETIKKACNTKDIKVVDTKSRRKRWFFSRRRGSRRGGSRRRGSRRRGSYIAGQIAAGIAEGATNALFNSFFG